MIYHAISKDFGDGRKEVAFLRPQAEGAFVATLTLTTQDARQLIMALQQAFELSDNALLAHPPGVR